MAYLFAHSGDILNRSTSENKRRHSIVGTTREELFGGLASAFHDFKLSTEQKSYFLKDLNNNRISYPSTRCSRYPKCHELTVKIFLNEYRDGVIDQCLNELLPEIELENVDFLIVSLDAK